MIRPPTGFVVLSLVLIGGCASVTEQRTREVASPIVQRAPEPAWEVIGSYSTRFDVQQIDRSFNIGQAVKQLDGVEIPAHGAFSFNESVGRRTLEGGWRMAPVLVLEGVELAVGGGICQVSSTVYNAALLGDMSVTTRFPHTRPVRYVPLGRDATVSWGAKDLRLVNPHSFPVRITARLAFDRLVIELRAPRTLPYEVRVETADAEPATPKKELQVLENPDRLAVGGVWIKLYRHRLRDGSVYESERVGRASFYPYKIKEPLR